MSAYQYILILPHPDHDAVAVLLEPHGVALPMATQMELHFWQEVEHVNQLAYGLLGIRTITRRCLTVHYDQATEVRTTVYLLEATATLLQHNAIWLPVAAARDQLPAEQQLLLATWLFWERNADQRCVPWYRVGWFEQVGHWLTTQLGSVDQIVQLRSWQRSAVARVVCGNQLFYFKATPPQFQHEIPLGVWLGQHFRSCCPAVYAVDAEQRWLLCHAAPGTVLTNHAERAHWIQVLRCYAELQIASLPHLPALIDLGMPVRDDSWLLDGLTPLLNDRAALLVNQPGGLTEAEYAHLQALLPQLHEQCLALQSCGMPLAIEHGDFGAWQVLVHEQQITYLDWSDSALANPLWSLASFLIDLPEALTDMRTDLIDAYLVPWEALVPAQKLRQAWALSERLIGLNIAMVHQRAILPEMEHRWEVERTIPYFVRQLLA